MFALRKAPSARRTLVQHCLPRWQRSTRERTHVKTSTRHLRHSIISTTSRKSSRRFSGSSNIWSPISKDLQYLKSNTKSQRHSVDEQLQLLPIVAANSVYRKSPILPAQRLRTMQPKSKTTHHRAQITPHISAFAGFTSHRGIHSPFLQSLASKQQKDGTRKRIFSSSTPTDASDVLSKLLKQWKALLTRLKASLNAMDNDEDIIDKHKEFKTLENLASASMICFALSAYCDFPLECLVVSLMYSSWLRWMYLRRIGVLKYDVGKLALLAGSMSAFVAVGTPLGGWGVVVITFPLLFYMLRNSIIGYHVIPVAFYFGIFLAYLFFSLRVYFRRFMKRISHDPK